MSKRTWLAIALVLGLGLAAAAAGVTSGRKMAEAKCWPNRVNDGLTYFDGRVRHPATGPTGITSYILNYSPWVQPGSAATAW